VENPAIRELGPFISNEFGDRYLYPVNRDTFKSTGAYLRFKKQFNEDLFQENTLHILVGTDSGLLLQYIRTVGIPPTSRYLFIELPHVLQRLQQEGLLDDMHERVLCISAEELNTAAEKFEFANYLYTERINIWKSFAVLDAFLQEYAELHWTTRDFIEIFAWRIKTQLGNQIFMKRQLENLGENRTTAACLKNLFPGKTAVLLAGGPSLDNHLEWIKQHRDKLVVLAVSRIARRLRQVGITPDIFFSVDPYKPSFDVSKEMLLFGDRTLFVNSFHVVPQLLSQWQGPSVFVGKRFPWPEESTENFLDAPGPTVTNTAFATAMQMGFRQIVLAGVDLCFSPEGYSHAQGTYERQAGPQFNRFDTQIETNQGSKAFTSRAMAEAITSLGNLAEIARQLDCKVINLTAQAAKIPHVEQLPAEKIEVAPLTESAWESIRKALPAEDRKTRTVYYRDVLAKLQVAEANIKKIKKLAIAGLKCNDGLFGRSGLQADFKYKIRMDRIEKKLCRPPLADYARIVKEVGLPHFLKIARPDNDREWSDAQVEESGRVYYQAYLDSAAQMLTLLEKAVERIELRLEEESLQADLSGLARSWQENEEPGRAIIWQQRHGNGTERQSQHQNAALQALQSAHESIFSKKPDYLVKGTKSSADPNMARHRIKILFKNKDLAALSGLLQGLAASTEECNIPAYHLAAGFAAELEDNPATALDAYQQVLETASGAFVEDALHRIASLSLSLGDPHNALLALECLAQSSPIFLAQYADLSKMLGQTKTALDAYASYLEHFPDDMVVLFKVGQIYQQEGQAEFARTVFQHILDQDPQNESARQALETSARIQAQN
jgi:tetratricopeptide (TPR) repeat protein